MYKISMKCYTYGSKEPYIEYVDEIYSTMEKAQEDVELLANEETDRLNEGRESKDFVADFDGPYYGIVRFWDGDDYMVVTEYEIKEID